jgi:hypothetical protein
VTHVHLVCPPVITCFRHGRLYNHLLGVTDDEEFYGRGSSSNSSSTASGGAASESLTLGQARAVVTSLNSLVYHTYLPVNGTSVPNGTGSAGVTSQQHLQLGSAAAEAHGSTGLGKGLDVSSLISGDPTEPLTEHAPLLLRSLYERDTRWVGGCAAQVVKAQSCSLHIQLLPAWDWLRSFLCTHSLTLLSIPLELDKNTMCSNNCCHPLHLLAGSHSASLSCGWLPTVPCLVRGRR